MTALNPGPASSISAADPVATQSYVGAQILASAPTKGGLNLTLATRNRTALIGDSQLANNYLLQNVLTTPGGLVVVNGLATVTTQFAHNITPGSYFHIHAGINTAGDPTWMLDPFNGTNPLCLSAPTSTTLTFATTAANGDYSSGYGQGWYVSLLSDSGDFGSWAWMQLFSKHPWQVVAKYCIASRTSSDVLLLMPKILAGPTFDEAVIAVCGADIYINAANNTTAAQAASVTCYQNMTGIGLANPASGILPQLFAYGARVTLLAPSGIPASFAGSSYRTAAAANLRRALKNWCFRYPNQVRYLDQFGQMTLGTSTSGDVVSGYTLSNDSHPTTKAAVNVARTLMSDFANWFPPSADTEPVNVLEDSATYSQPGAQYPNIVPHGMMDGTTGNIGSGLTGTLPTGWTNTGAGGTVTAAGQTARTATGSGNNSGNWGYCTDVTFSGTGPFLNMQSSDFHSALVPGAWYEFGFVVRAIGTQTGFVGCSAQLFMTATGKPNTQIIAARTMSTWNNGWPLVDGDTLYVKSDPWQCPASYSPTSATMTIGIGYTGAATGHLQFSNAFFRQIDSPYA